MEILPQLNYWLAVGTILLQLATIKLVVVYALRTKSPYCARLAERIRPHALRALFVISLIATFVTLYYSDYLGIEPCPLCWWQRIFLYPQVILLGIAAWKKDNYIADYAIVLSIFGAGVALYQHALQMLPGSGLPCPATGISCTQRFLFEFGYITYPLMAFSLFAFLIVTMLFVRARRVA